MVSSFHKRSPAVSTVGDLKALQQSDREWDNLEIPSVTKFRIAEALDKIQGMITCRLSLPNCLAQQLLSNSKKPVTSPRNGQVGNSIRSFRIFLVIN